MTPPRAAPSHPALTAGDLARPQGSFGAPGARRASLADPEGPKPGPSTPTTPD